MLEPIQTNDRLLTSLAEQLKVPFLQIARSAELAKLHGVADENLDTMLHTANSALQLVDGYLLSAELHKQTALKLEPVSLSALLQDVAHRLTPFAKANNCSVELNLSGKYGPVMADPTALNAAYDVLGLGMIEAQQHSEKSTVVLAAYRSKTGLAAGVFSSDATFTADAFRRGLALYGSAQQSMHDVSALSGAGFFVAHSLLDAMSAQLRVARHKNLSGLAATLLPSKQLELVTT